MRVALNAVNVMIISILMWGCSSVQPTSKPVEPKTTTTPDQANYTQTGKASFYGHGHQSKKTASGELYDLKLLTAAHRTIPLGTNVKVTNVDNGKSVVVKINDRGPFIKNRILDLSQSAFDRIADTSTGIINVKIEAIDQP